MPGAGAFMPASSLLVGALHHPATSLQRYGVRNAVEGNRNAARFVSGGARTGNCGSTASHEKAAEQILQNFRRISLQLDEQEDERHSATGDAKVQEQAAEPRFPWEMDTELGFEEEQQQIQRQRPPSLAELVIPDKELKRLKGEIPKVTERLKLKRLEISNAVVLGIHRRWEHAEIVKVKCERPASLRMKWIHEELEKRTGGLVIWREGSALVIYRGRDYEGPPESLLKRIQVQNERASTKTETRKAPEIQKKEPTEEECVANAQYQMQMDILLDKLGTRCTDWGGPKPFPVDADKLPQIDHTYKRPFRYLPSGMEPNLSNKEFAELVRMAKAIPPHFALSRSKGLQGLAHAMVKLWESSEIAKIAIKQTAGGSNSGRMADELKRQTGGILLGCSEGSVMFYRGKDFLPASVASAYEERERAAVFNSAVSVEDSLRSLHTDHVTQTGINDRDAQIYDAPTWEEEKRRREAAEKSVRSLRARRLGKQLEEAMRKKRFAEEAIKKIDSLPSGRKPDYDRETITEEERHMFRKLGLKMHSFLLLGRRGVYSGIIENMHLHWKYKDLVKVIFKGKDRPDIEKTAKLLEDESGGILVAIMPTSKGAAMIFYRGKNYRRPSELRPRSLLTKRKALEKHAEMQRHEALTRHIVSLQKQIRSLGYKLGVRETEDIRVRVEIDAREDSKMKRRSEEIRTLGALGPILGAEQLTNRQRLLLRKKALSAGKPCHFHVGKSGVHQGLVLSIRKHFKTRALVKIGIKGRAAETSAQDIVKLIRDGTGAAFVSQEQHKVIFYRGWPDNAQYPDYVEEDVTAELIAAVKEEDDGDCVSYYGWSNAVPFPSDFELDDNDGEVSGAFAGEVENNDSSAEDEEQVIDGDNDLQ